MPEGDRTIVEARPAEGFLDEELWDQLEQADTLKPLSEAWLHLLVEQLPECEAARVALVDDTAVDADPVVASYPDLAPYPDLSEALDEAFVQRSGIVRDRTDGVAGVILAYPIRGAHGEPSGAAALLVPAVSQEDMHLAMRQLQWGIGQLESRLSRWSRQDTDADEAAQWVVMRLAGVLDTDSYKAAARALCTEVAEATGAERVSFGHLVGKRSRVVAISHTAQFGRRMALVRSLEGAMDEALDRREAIAVPDLADGRNIAAPMHEALRESQGLAGLLTMPLERGDSAIGALTLEFEDADRFAASDLARLDALAALAAPVMIDKRANDRWLVSRAGQSALRAGYALVGPGHGAAKLATLAGIAIVLLFSLWKAPHDIRANATVQGRELRAVAAQFDGFLGTAEARAGDLVVQGQVLARLEDRDLQLERLRWQAEFDRYAIEFETALTNRDRAEMRIAESLRDQAEAQLALVEGRIARSVLRAPFDALIVSGDLSQRLGSAVSRGEVLFELAPQDAFRLRLEVPEHRIADVDPEGTGAFVAGAFTESEFGISVSRVSATAEIAQSQNIFVVEATIEDGPAEILRPGLAGAARLEGPPRHVIWIWTRPMIQRMQLALWRWI